MAKEPTIDEEARHLDVEKDGRELRKDFRRTRVTILLAIIVVVIALVILVQWVTEERSEIIERERVYGPS